MVTDAPGSWRGPYVVIGVVGAVWILAWMPLSAGVRLDGADDHAASAPNGSPRRDGAERGLVHSSADRSEHAQATTAENMVVWMWDKLAPHLPELKEIMLWETPEYCVTYRK